jgi:diguanylate cyclase (GGDEF)-like protein
MMNEDDRLRALHDFALLDTPNEQEFDELVNLASEVCSTPISLVSLLDDERQWFKAAVVDNFKKRNDEFGHAAGDEALRLLGDVLLETCRAGDLAARLGGEEFGFLLPETDVEAAMVFAQRIQSRLREIPCGPTELTVSIGIAAMSEKTETWERLASRADAAMYEAKQSGKSRAVIHRDHITQLIQNLNRRSQAS